MNSQIILSDIPKAQEGKIVKYVRSDGFPVFLDGDKELDSIRIHCKKSDVIKAVAIRRCQQIARNYSLQYAPELLHCFEVTSLTKEILKNQEKEHELVLTEV